MIRMDLPHQVCDYTCMVSGLQDQYEFQTGSRLPDWFFFYMSGMAGFAYIRSSHAPVQRMVNWGVRIQDQFTRLADAVGFTWQIHRCSSFTAAWKQAVRALAEGHPPVLGALDMYHLPYFSHFYHRFHIPYHYVLLVGVDEQSRTALVLDCGRAEPQSIPLSDLAAAWQVNTPGISGPNTLFTFDWPAVLPTEHAIARRALRRQADTMLHPQAAMLGIPGILKLSRELPRWPVEMNSEILNRSLLWFVEFTGTPPLLPRRLLGESGPEDHTGSRRGFVSLLRRLGAAHNTPLWTAAAGCLEHSGACIAQVTERIIDTIQGDNRLAEAAVLLAEAARHETDTCELLLSAAETG